MPQLLGVRIENFRSLADVTLGQIADSDGEPLPPLMCFIGPNGSGKSSLLDAFGFLADCLMEGIEAACDKPNRGGFLRLRTQDSTEPIRFSLYYRQTKSAQPISYSFEIADNGRGLPVVISERLRQRRIGSKSGLFLSLKRGTGRAWAGQFVEGSTVAADAVPIKLTDLTQLGITVLGQLSEHPRIVALRKYIESWYLSYFMPDVARLLPPAGAQKHLDRTGANLGNVVQYLERTHADSFQRVLQKIAARIPGVRKIQSKESPDGRLLLQFNERGFSDPFYQQSMSDGTLKMFAYLLLLEDPEPPSFIGIEEPENGLYHKLLDQLAREFNRHAADSKQKLQMLVTTHSPHFVDALQPEQVWMLRKNERGHTTATRTADIPLINALKGEGIPLGSLWYSNHLEESEPR